jgi:SPP1 gp7 family putative phage head morphogenesis protein
LKVSPHRKKLPPQRPAKLIEGEYAAALGRIVIGAVRRAYKRLIKEAPKLAEARRARLDADQWTRFAGFDVCIENPAGSIRNWYDQSVGCTGSTVMACPYGYIAGAVGADGEEVDVYLGPDESAPMVYVVHQQLAPDYKSFDEDKVMLGFPSADAAKNAYLQHRDDPRAYGGMSEFTLRDFKGKVFAGVGQSITHGAKLGVTRLDSEESRKVQRLINQAAAELKSTVSKRQIGDLAKKFAERTSTHQRMQLQNQVRSVLGANALSSDPDLGSHTADFVRENVSLVSRIPERLHGELSTLVHRAVSGGRLGKDLADDIEERFGVAERHAALIARDQVTKFAAKANLHRQRHLGVKRGIWRTMQDERVRELHQDLEGTIVNYADEDDWPEISEGEYGLPGDAVQCRCFLEPMLDDLDEDEDDDDDEGDDDDEDDEDDDDEDEDEDEPDDE